MNSPYDPSDPPAILFTQIQEAEYYAAHSKTPFSDGKLSDAAYNLVFQKGVFSEEWKQWRQRTPPLTKTWSDFQIWLTEEHQECCEDQKLTVQHRKNHENSTYIEEHLGNQERTIEAIANLATATSSDRNTEAQLKNTIAQLKKDLKVAHDKLILTLEANVFLKKQVNRTKITSPTNRDPDAKIHYCCTHRFEFYHTIHRCTERKTGHQQKEMARKNLDRSQINKEAWKKILIENSFGWHKIVDSANKQCKMVNNITKTNIKHNNYVLSTRTLKTPPIMLPQLADMGSRCSSYTIRQDAQVASKTPILHPIHCGTPTGHTMSSKKSSILDYTSIQTSAKQENIYPKLQ